MIWMVLDMIANYDKKYSKKEFYWGLKPHKLVKHSLQYLPENAKVLDLGCGEGKDSFFLAKRFDVTAVDISKEGIVKLKETNSAIKTEVSDINSYLEHCENFDCIFCINTIQFMTNIPETIRKIKSKSKLSVIASFITKNLKENQLKELYSDWDILLYKEILGNWETHGEAKHRHHKIFLIARKPANFSKILN